MVSTKNVSKSDEILSVASTRGFFFPTAGIYGGRAGFYTYGHLGKLLKSNWEFLWRKHFLSKDNFWEVQSNNILPEPVFKASGHLENFSECRVKCSKCNSEFRIDDIVLDDSKCLKCNNKLVLSKDDGFNMMFPLVVGSGEKAYLSPETAQGAYITFKDEFKATRGKLPLGLAILDKAYRNELSPRNLFFRLREFSQAELQIFFNPDLPGFPDDVEWKGIKDYGLLLAQADNNHKVSKVSCSDAFKKFKLPKFYLSGLVRVQKFFLDIIGVPSDKFRLFEVPEGDRAFYNRIHYDVEILLDSLGGFKEVAGVHYRGDHDLSRHQSLSKEKLEVFHDGKRFIPHVLELSFGVDRNVWLLFDIFYHKDLKKSDTLLFRFPKLLAPFQVSVLPLVNKEGLDVKALEIHNSFRNAGISSFFDDSGSIGKRYARNDEAGTPFCVTVDGQTLDDESVTIRVRDTSEQSRVKIGELIITLQRLLSR